MLQLKPNCENCGKLLPNESSDAMICTFECTFCKECVETILYNVCPNCGGGFEKRPSRPKDKLIKYPASIIEFIKPVDMKEFKPLFDNYKNVEARKR